MMGLKTLKDFKEYHGKSTPRRHSTTNLLNKVSNQTLDAVREESIRWIKYLIEKRSDEIYNNAYLTGQIDIFRRFFNITKEELE